MPNRILTGTRASILQSSLGADGTNAECHGNTDGVQPNDRAILAHVKVTQIFWGQFYADHPDALDFGTQLCKDLISGPYFNGLAQYGVGHGSLGDTGRTLTKAAPKTLSEDEARDAVKEFVGGGGFTPPATNETSRLYVLYLPVETRPTIASGKDDFCGYHKSTKIDDLSRHDDLFYVIIRTDKVADLSSGASLIRSVSACVSHEIAEAVTDRDGRGYHGAPCEIGDLCEQNGTFKYRGWDVEQYWSQLDRSCINGDQAVSLRQFLQAKTGHLGSLRIFGPTTIDTDFIASQFR